MALFSTLWICAFKGETGRLVTLRLQIKDGAPAGDAFINLVFTTVTIDGVSTVPASFNTSGKVNVPVIPRTLTGATADGVSDVTTTTKVDLTFNESITITTIVPANIKVEGTGDTAVTVDSVTGTGATRSAAISGVWEDGDTVTVSVINVASYEITGTQTVTLYREAPPPTGIENITIYIIALISLLTLSAVLWGVFVYRKARKNNV